METREIPKEERFKLWRNSRSAKNYEQVFSKTGSFNNTVNKLKKMIAFILSIVLTVIIIYFWIFKSISYNHKQAHISKEEDRVIVTVFATREITAHDPFSLLFRKINKDSLSIIIPRSQGEITAPEVVNTQANFKYIKGNILINENQIIMDLYYVDAYYKTIVATSWNGNYELEWIK